MKKIIVYVVAVFFVIVSAFLIFSAIERFEYLKAYKDYSTINDPAFMGRGLYYARLFQKELRSFILSFVGAAALLFCAYILLFRNQILIPLTPEQAAERKRVIAERKKAKLQEKLNKLND